MDPATIGIGTYALFWESGIGDAGAAGEPRETPEPPATAPLSILGGIERAAELGCGVFQICDDPRIEGCAEADLARLRGAAGERGLRLELGTRGVGREHLEQYVRIARALDARVLRSMVQRQDVREAGGGLEGAAARLRELIPVLEQADVTLALETYEQLPTGDLLEIIERVDSPRIGVCLDPANCVAALEHPDDVIERTAPHVVNVHVKDFRFDREAGWAGFRLSGARMGEGLLDLDHLIEASRREGRSPSFIVEHWLSHGPDREQTIAREREWTAASIAALRER